MASENSRALSLDEHVKRINSQDKVATGVLTVIVGLVMLLVVAIIAYILVRGAGRALTPGFLTNPYNDEVVPGIIYQLWDSFYMLIVTLVISVPISLGAAIFLVEYAPDNWVTSAAKTAIETLAVQMVIGGVERSMPMGLLDPASTLTAALTAGLSNAVSGSVYYHALWSLGLILLAMSLIFILIIHLIGKKGAKANG